MTTNDDDAPADLALTGVDSGFPITLGDTDIVNAWGLCDADTPAVAHMWRAV